ncbi:hypothetical protein nbrc107696_08270 [Gordonia spumicola]|uniref:Uncharacterized protein n=1 Tax=Gordonia spumicola TaxID=589161 RepID=A0A7I9V5S1_9ACTN|nr:hypothetical protein [Gordonia spumicola]GEE00381.1 hypothetical protein nbrc107696_08270 [Gordonia spumicola]
MATLNELIAEVVDEAEAQARATWAPVDDRSLDESIAWARNEAAYGCFASAGYGLAELTWVDPDQRDYWDNTPSPAELRKLRREATVAAKAHARELLTEPVVDEFDSFFRFMEGYQAFEEERGPAPKALTAEVERLIAAWLEAA